MLSFTSGSPVYLACGSTDMRKSIDGLAAVVQEQFALDPFSSALFVFCNRSRDKLIESFTPLRGSCHWAISYFKDRYRQYSSRQFHLNNFPPPSISFHCQACPFVSSRTVPSTACDS
ncbi:IS66 family insertion sequence element accessory protein TnpB [Paenibacillus periandrae]|uniref:IS66 family insertion sequence element accessory protein TnpB n=1 Tax=Paenibacillus periandrae TaxID=1761741 RepID=UPI003B830AC5